MEPALAALADGRGAIYEPNPRGLFGAREAVARYYATHGVNVQPSNIVLTASTSEAYSWLFKLLCEPGDVVLVPAPSYPLLDALAGLESISLERYPLPFEGEFEVRMAAIRDALEECNRSARRVRAVVLVNPNNPTGTSIEAPELAQLLELAGRLDFAIISDEVFLDYREEGESDNRVRVAASRESPALVFSLAGLSKSAALPQLKLAWIVVNGPRARCQDALERLDWIADTFLSVATPVQVALPTILERAERTAEILRLRLAGNRRSLGSELRASAGVACVSRAAGWSSVLRVPAVISEEDLVLRLLEQHGVLVQPGFFFDFPFEAFLVVSLLPEPEVFQEGIARLSAVCSLPR